MSAKASNKTGLLRVVCPLKGSGENCSPSQWKEKQSEKPFFDWLRFAHQNDKIHNDAETHPFQYKCKEINTIAINQNSYSLHQTKWWKPIWTTKALSSKMKGKLKSFNITEWPYASISLPKIKLFHRGFTCTDRDSCKLQ